MLSTIDRYIEQIARITSAGSSRSEIIRTASLIAVIANVLLATSKLIAGTIAHSLSIISDAINNYTDAFSSIIALIGIHLSSRKADHDHPLGYGRVEYVSSLIVSILVVVAGVELFREVFGRFSDPQPPSYAPWHIIFLLFLVAAKWLVSRLTMTYGRLTHYGALIASGEEGNLDVYVSLLTIGAAIVTQVIEWEYIDPLVGLFLSAFIFYTGLKLVSEATQAILGQRPGKELVEEIKKIVTSHPPIMGAYDLVVHTYGPTLQVGSINVELPDTTPVSEAYSAMVKAQTEVYQRFKIYLTIGLYSINTADQSFMNLRRDISEFVTSFDGALSIHAFTHHPQTNLVSFDVVVAFSVTDFRAFENTLLTALKEKYPHLTFAINLDLDYS